jgi:group I intron endonuclease
MNENEIKYFIYKTTNLINGKIYIGYHASSNINKDSYLGSGYLLKKAVEKYGKQNFKREILYVFDSQEDATKKEREIVNEEFIERDDVYNLCLGGFGGGLPGELNPFWGKTHSDETKEYLRDLFTGRKLSDDWKQNISDGLNKSEKFQIMIHSEERAKKIGLSNSKLWTPEYREKFILMKKTSNGFV